MKKYYIYVSLCLGIIANPVHGQKDINLSLKKEKELKLDTRVDNMGYWNRMIELGVTKPNPPIPFKPGVFKGSQIEADGIKAQDSPDVPVSSSTDIAETENSIFVDPGNNRFVLNSNNSTSWSGSSVGVLYGANYFLGSDVGTSWGGSALGAGGSNSGDPAAAINLDGSRMYVGLIDAAYGMSVAYSIDGGNNFSNVYVAGGGYLLDKNHLGIDIGPLSPYEGNLYNVWTNLQGGATDSEIEYSRSTDGGLSWSNSVVLSAPINAGSHNQGVNVQCGPAGEVYIVWTVYDSWPSDETAIGLTKSIDGGVTFNTATRIVSNIRGIRDTGVPQNMRVNSFPSMAVDISGGTNNGNVYIVWTNIGTPGVNTGTAGIYMIKSTNGGSTWSSPVKVNTGSGTAYFPWITCDPDKGTLSVIFYDNRNTASADCEAWVAYSKDAGATWTDFKVSDVSFTPGPITGLAAGYFGDYLGITSRGGLVYPCWTDNRDGGRPMTYVSPFVTDLNAGFVASSTHICNGSNVLFTDQSNSPVPITSWTWSFPGGSPSSFSGQNPPPITYNSTGTYDISLTVGDGTETDIEAKTAYITVDNIIAEFSGSPTNVIVGNTVTFTDNSACSPTSWTWSFPGGIPTTASGPGPHIISYNTLGIFNASLTVSNASFNDTETKTSYIEVTEVTYCIPTYSSGTGLGDYISLVQLGDIDNATGALPSPYYNYYSSLSTDLIQDQSYTITLSPGTYESGNNIAVWIDYNRDGIFDEITEKLGTAILAPMPATGTINFTVPANAIVGTTRMRVREVWNNFNFGACSQYGFGETEDYNINILGSDIRVNLTAFLEGPFNGSNMDANIIPHLPLSQPFNVPPWNYTGFESVGSMPNPNIVDWVLVDVRDAVTAATATSATSVAKQAAFILNDGSIVGLDGISNLIFDVSINQNLFAVVWHRNHLGIMSNDPLVETGGIYTYDYTSGINQVFGGIDGHKQISIGIWGMIGGDANHDGFVNVNDKSPVWENEAGEQGYIHGDYNLDGETNNQDKDDIWVPNEGKSSKVPN